MNTLDGTDRIIELMPVQGRLMVLRITVNGKQAGFIRQKADKLWWGLGCPWPGFKTSNAAARRVVAVYDEIQAELAQGRVS